MGWKWRWGRRPDPLEPFEGPVEPRAFDEVLRQAVTNAPPVHPLAEALAEARADFDAISNMGETADSRDLFTQIDRLSTAVVKAYPESLCYEGCGRCCQYPTAFFDIYPQEWDLLRRHLETRWEPEQLARVVERFWTEHGPRLGVIRIFEFFLWLSVPIFPTRKALPLACPLLENGRCTVWEARPFQCRTYGQFLARTPVAREPYVYACAEQSAALNAAVAAAEPPVQLPDLNVFMRKQYRFVRGTERHSIAGWVARTYPRPGSWRARWRAAVAVARTLFGV